MTCNPSFDLADPSGPLPEANGRCQILVRLGPRTLGAVPADNLAWTDPRRLRDDLLLQFGEQLYGLLAVAPDSGCATIDPSAVSIVVCTRNRAMLLDGCLHALRTLDPPAGEILVVDNAPDDGTTADVAMRHGVRRVMEPEPGLNRARNRGWRAARGAIVAYIDDDARVDPRFATAVASGFVAPEVACVTGLVLAAELATNAQRHFEMAEGGMRKGAHRRWFHRDANPVGLQAFRLGVGTNMAFRRRALNELGGFDPRLDVGTATRGGGDLDMLFRVLDAGHVLLYEPDAVVRHHHRQTTRQLADQFHDYGVAYTAFLTKRAGESREAARAARREQLRWHLRRHARGTAAAIVRRQPRRLLLMMAEAAGSLRGARALASQGGWPPIPPAEVRAQ